MSIPSILGPLEARREQASTPRPWNFKLTGSHTGGLVAVGQGDLPPHHAGPPLHVHRSEDELFLALDGVLTMQVGDALHEVAAGGLAWAARGTPHAFANRSEATVRLMSFIVPAGLERMFFEQDAYLESMSGRPDVERLAAISESYGVKTVGPQISVTPR